MAVELGFEEAESDRERERREEASLQRRSVPGGISWTRARGFLADTTQDFGLYPERTESS